MPLECRSREWGNGRAARELWSPGAPGIKPEHGSRKLGALRGERGSKEPLRPTTCRIKPLVGSRTYSRLRLCIRVSYVCQAACDRCENKHSNPLYPQLFALDFLQSQQIHRDLARGWEPLPQELQGESHQGQNIKIPGEMKAGSQEVLLGGTGDTGWGEARWEPYSPFSKILLPPVGLRKGLSEMPLGGRVAGLSSSRCGHWHRQELTQFLALDSMGNPEQLQNPAHPEPSSASEGRGLVPRRLEHPAHAIPRAQPTGSEPLQPSMTLYDPQQKV